MKVWMKWLMAPVACAAIVACGGFSEQEAADRCAQEQEARQSACFDSGSLAVCKAAFEDCGDDVVIDATACPLTFTCPDGGDGGAAAE